jgi:N-acetylglucosaminyl-diphospho-decaprenol L-rhamnosyltransferase
VTFHSDRAAVIIVGFRNAADVSGCVAALARSTVQNFDIFVCENGGSAAFQDLSERLVRDNIVVNFSPDNLLYGQPRAATEFVSLVSCRLRETAITLFIGEAAENLGYAGAINKWLQLLLEQPGYTGFWILNPDTYAEPDALSELVKYVKSSGKGMVGSRIMSMNDLSRIHSRGLRWRPIKASTQAVDLRAATSLEPNTEKVEKCLDAPSGSSFYVTRSCVEQIGLMDERYFLYFEDLDWGMRAKARCGLGYAHRAVVQHRGGTTIGPTARSRVSQSPLSVYLQFRNRVLFVKSWYPAWFPWTLFVLTLRAFEYAIVGSLQNTKSAFHGISAGLAGQIGRPDEVMRHHDITKPRSKEAI